MGGQPKERWYVELERDIYSRDSLLIPMLEDGRGPADEEEEVIKFPAKAYLSQDKKPKQIKPIIDETTEADFQCPESSKVFTNVNNLKYHQSMHHEMEYLSLKKNTNLN